ncbi:MAG: hypothetical protein U1A78_02835 [Polyangia bacterium]
MRRRSDLSCCPRSLLAVLLLSALAPPGCSRGGSGDGKGGSDLAGVFDDLRSETKDQSSDSIRDLRGERGDLESLGDLGGGGTDLGPPAMCSTARSPAHSTTTTTTHNLPDPDEPYVFAAGSSVYSALSFASNWSTFTGTGWSESPIPWPPEIAKNPDGSPRALRLHSCNYRGIKELPDGRALFMAVEGSSYWLVNFDGVALRDPLKLPSGGAIPCARTRDGRYHHLSGARLFSGDAKSGWDTGTPVPLPSLGWTDVDLAATRDDRIVITYAAAKMTGSPRHVWVLSKPPGGAWGPAQDITPSWAVDAYGPQAVPARDGGLVVAATGGGGSYGVPAIWRSTDAVTFGAADNILSGFIDASLITARATCLGSTLVALRNRAGMATAFELYVQKGTGWVQLDRTTGTYLQGAAATLLPDGRAFWGYSVPNSMTVKATM